MTAGRPKKPNCSLRSCANRITENLYGRCSLGLRYNSGVPCEQYRPLEGVGSSRLPRWYGKKRPTKPVCELRSCVYQVTKNFLGRCSLGFTYYGGPCDKYQPRGRNLPKWYSKH